MNYFNHTEQLLSKPSFLEYAGKLYHDFIDLEAGAVADEINLGEDFKIDVSRWNLLCKDDNLKRSFSGGVSSFLLYAKHRAGELVRKDWVLFQASLSGELKKDQSKILTFLEDAIETKETMRRRAYLEPLTSILYEELDSIIAEYGEIPARKPTIGGLEMNFEPMQWNANINILSTLFYDLARKEVTVKGERMMALQADSEQIKKFIAMCFTFRGDDISEPSLKTHFDEKRPEKRATDKKISIEEYFEHEGDAS